MTTFSLFTLNQVFIYRNLTFLQLRRFWNKFKTELTDKGFYKISIDSMGFRLQKLKKTDLKAQKPRQYPESYKEIDGVLYY